MHRGLNKLNRGLINILPDISFHFMPLFLSLLFLQKLPKRSLYTCIYISHHFPYSLTDSSNDSQKLSSGCHSTSLESPLKVYWFCCLGRKIYISCYVLCLLSFSIILTKDCCWLDKWLRHLASNIFIALLEP